MSNAAKLELSSGAEVAPDVYICTFQTAVSAGYDESSSEFAPSKIIAQKIQIQAGPAPSYAVVSVPMADLAAKDETPHAVAFQKDGPLGKIKLRSRATICHTCGGSSTVILSGSVVDISHDLAMDSATVIVVDDRWLLSKITVFGQIQYDPVDGWERFVAAEPCIFNTYGWPTCMDTDGGPRFAPSHRYGYTFDATAEREPGSATDRARSWRITDAIEYLRAAHYGRAGLRPQEAEYYGNPYTPASVFWPKNLGSMLVVTDKIKQLGGDRPLCNYVADGKPLVDVLSELARMAGPFDLFLTPANNG